MASTPERTPPTIRDLAKATGFSRSTVGAALQNRADIAVATRRTIQRAAARLGYRQDPEIQRLMTYLRVRRGRRQLIPLALLHETQGNDETWRRLAWNKETWEGIATQAERLGFHVSAINGEPFRRRPEGLRRVVVARGIRGLIVDSSVSYGLPASARLDRDFAAVWLRAHPWRSPFHTVCPDYGYNLQRALGELSAMGYRRPGLALLEYHADRSDHLYHSAFVWWQQQAPPANRVPPLTYPYQRTGTPEVFRIWLERHQPDVLLVNDVAIARHVAACGRRIPSDAGLVHLNLASDVARWTGIRAGNARMGHAVVDVLASQFLRGDIGAPAHPRSLLVRGEWVLGETTSVRSG